MWDVVALDLRNYFSSINPFYKFMTKNMVSYVYISSQVFWDKEN